MYTHLKPAKRARADDTDLPAQLLALRMAKPAKAANKEETKEENIDREILYIQNLKVLNLQYSRSWSPLSPPPLQKFCQSHGQAAVSVPPVFQELEDRIHGSFPMLQDTLLGLTHGEGTSEWAVTAYKDAQLVRLDPISLSGV
ncbi:hypothetical protein DSO57_1009977 [Entomophthora muscae]|uniref:Uncharacterized protein n=1 Tax=Entomophthora muscae TaxID=34485 RepID=A0ACC2USA4_9FUNG|nr:hypothetical protein DSO57_1009977 [Entomophthora muscae]